MMSAASTGCRSIVIVILASLAGCIAYTSIPEMSRLRALSMEEWRERILATDSLSEIDGLITSRVTKIHNPNLESVSNATLRNRFEVFLKTLEDLYRKGNQPWPALHRRRPNYGGTADTEVTEAQSDTEVLRFMMMTDIELVYDLPHNPMKDQYAEALLRLRPDDSESWLLARWREILERTGLEGSDAAAPQPVGGKGNDAR